MEKEDVKEVLLQVLELQLDYQCVLSANSGESPTSNLLPCAGGEEGVSLSLTSPLKY